MIDILLLTFIASLIGTGIGSAFPPAQTVKHWLRIGIVQFRQMLDNGKESGIHFLIAKAVNCNSCMSFWTAIAASLIAGDLMAWVVAAPCAYVLASILGSITGSSFE